MRKKHKMLIIKESWMVCVSNLKTNYIRGQSLVIVCEFDIYWGEFGV